MISNSSKLSSEDITKPIFESTNSVDAGPDFRCTDNEKYSSNVKENTLPIKISDDGSDNILSDISDDIEMLKKEKKKKEKKERKKEKRSKKKRRKRSRSPSEGRDDEGKKKSRRSKSSKHHSDSDYEGKHKKRRVNEEEDEEEHRKRKAEKKEKKSLKKEREKDKNRERESRKRRKHSRSNSVNRSRSFSSSSHERDTTSKRINYKKNSEKKYEPFLKRRAMVTAYQVEAANGSKFSINKCEWLSELTGAAKRISPQKNNKFKRNFNKVKMFKKQQYSPPREVIDKQALLEKAKINAAKLALKGELKREDVMIHTGGKSLETYIEQASNATENTVMTSLGPLVLPKVQQPKKEPIDLVKTMGVEAISDESEDEDAKWEKIEKAKAKTKVEEEEEHHIEIKKVPSSNALKFNISNFRAVPTKTVEERLLDEHKTKECINSQNSLLNKWVPVNVNQAETTSKIRYSVNTLSSANGKSKQAGHLKMNNSHSTNLFDDLDLPPPPAPPTINISKGDDFNLPPPPVPPLVSTPKLPTLVSDDFLPPPPLPPLPPPKTIVDIESVKSTMSFQKIIFMKNDAEKKLRDNPFDKEALQNLRDAEEFMKLWGTKTLLR
uniref:Uncharacterized protein n=1 Tax=Strongyloides stercoralis TaxID=6248 RepID=A0A0K0DSD3_STRER